MEARPLGDMYMLMQVQCSCQGLCPDIWYYIGQWFHIWYQKDRVYGEFSFLGNLSPRVCASSLMMVIRSMVALTSYPFPAVKCSSKSGWSSCGQRMPPGVSASCTSKWAEETVGGAPEAGRCWRQRLLSSIPILQFVSFDFPDYPAYYTVNATIMLKLNVHKTIIVG